MRGRANFVLDVSGIAKAGTFDALVEKAGVRRVGETQFLGKGRPADASSLQTL